jgi:hypothetical protein
MGKDNGQGKQQRTHHVRMPIKRLHSCQQLLVVPQTDQNLRVVPYSLLQDRERSLRDLLLLQLLDLALVHIRLAHVGELTSRNGHVSYRDRAAAALHLTHLIFATCLCDHD